MSGDDRKGGAVEQPVRAWLRIEGAAVLVAAIAGYAQSDHSWLLFAALFLVPDISFAGYLAGARAGAVSYNALHSYVGPVLLLTALLLTGRSLAVPLLWLAHIGFDRVLGYGLKYPSGFHDTHLGRIGRSRQR